MTLPVDHANRNTVWASIFVEELHRGGVACACLAPGSRSTPLVLALARHPGITVYTLLDERSAGFFALGLAKASGRPVALLCTSGSAAANFHPAVVEADLSRVPLIVLTADRPAHLRDTGAGQTIDQIKLYGSAVRWFREVGEPVLRDPELRNLRTLASRAVLESCRPPAGPVHLNFPFRKPLEPIPVADDLPPSLEHEHGLALHGLPQGPYARVTLARPAAGPATLARLAERIAEAPRGLIVCGPMTFAPDPQPNGRDGQAQWPAALAMLAHRTGYPILAEPPAGLHCGPHDTSHLVTHAEAVLRARAFRSKLVPELVLRFGGMPTNKHVEVLLDEHPGCPLVLVNESGAWLEPTHHPTELVQAEPAGFCSALAETLPHRTSGGAWLAAFMEADRLAGDALAGLYRTPPPEGLGEAWFEGRVLSELAALLPEGAVQYTASSMPVRDLAAFSPATPQAVRHLVNRGANGIDGLISSALGAAAHARAQGGAPVVLVTGDVAFLHDAGALLAARQHGLPLLVVLINNDGGGIFEFLPIAEYGEAYETHFGTPHGTDFAALCAAHGVAHGRPADWGDFREQVRAALAAKAPHVIEVRTDRRHNRVQHGLVWEAVARRLAKAFPPGRTLS